jgi:branched-chain amino acid aminotransferase
LFCPDGDVQETGAANFLLLSDDEVITKSLDTSFLHGMTRASILTLANDIGYRVNEREFTVSEMLEWVTRYEAALSGTAATLTPAGRDTGLQGRGDSGPGRYCRAQCRKAARCTAGDSIR